MKVRILGLFGVALMISVVALAPVAGQYRAATNTWTPSRTSDGQPDLQGVWLNVFATARGKTRGLERESVSHGQRGCGAKTTGRSPVQGCH